MTIRKQREELAELATKMRALTARAKEADRGFTADEDAEWNSMVADFDAREAALKSAEAVATRDAELDAVIAKYVRDENGNPVRIGLPANSKGQPEHKPERRAKVLGKWVETPYARSIRQPEQPALPVAFDAFLRYGREVLSAEHRQMIERRGTDPQSVGTAALGGYTVPEGFSNQLEVALKAYGGLRNYATVFSTETGNVLPWPTVNDTGTTGALLAENTADAVSDVTFSEIQLDAYKYTSRIVLVSKELLQDSAFDIQSILVNIFAERLGRITSTHYVTGDGSGKPNGITNCTNGKTLAHKALASLTYDEMLDLKHSVDPAYRAGARWMFNDATFRGIKGLKDGESRPLWQPNIANAVPATIDGDEYVIDQAMPSFATLARPVVYGQLSKYLIRDVLGFELTVLRERYAEYHQVGFIAIMRTDGEILNAGGGPIKRMTCAT